MAVRTCCSPASSYDVIVSEPSNPWMAGIASLFTKEFFEAARGRLAPGGVLCQWAHTYDISTSDLQSIVATFTSVFPEALLFLVGDGDVLLIGSTASLDERLKGVAQPGSGRPRRRTSPASGAIDPLHVLSLLVAEDAGLRQWAAGAAIQTDNRADLEFSGTAEHLSAVRETTTPPCCASSPPRARDRPPSRPRSKAATRNRVARPRVDAVSRRRVSSGV